MRRGKRGISTVVATVLIILITVAAVSILWVAVIPMIKNSNLQPSTASLSIDTTEGFTAYDLQKDLLTVQVKRGSDDSVISGIQFVFTKNGVSETDLRNNVPGSNQAVTYNFNMSGFGKPDSIGIAPIDVNNNIGEVVSSITSILAGDLSAVSGDFPAVGSGGSCEYSSWESGVCGDGSNGCSAGQRVQSRTVTNGTGCNSLTQCVVDSSCNAVVPITSYVIDSCQEISHSGTYTLNKSVSISNSNDCFNITSDNVILNGNGFTVTGISSSNTGDGIGANGRNNLTIENFADITDFNMGVHFFATKRSVINSVVAENMNSYGILFDSDSQEHNCDNNVIEHVSINNTYDGIIIIGSNNSLFDVNNSNSNTGDTGGFGMTIGDGNTLTNVLSTLNSGDGIDLGNSNTLVNVNANRNQGNGILMAGSNTITNVNVNNNAYYGIYIMASSDGSGLNSFGNTITNVNANSNLGGGVYMQGSNLNNFTNISVNNNTGFGIELDGYATPSLNNTFTNITASSDGNYGIYLSSGSNNIINGLSAHSNDNGIYIGSSSSNNLISNSEFKPGVGTLTDIAIYSSGNSFVNNSLCNPPGDFYCVGTLTNTFMQSKCRTATCSGLACSPC